MPASQAACFRRGDKAECFTIEISLRHSGHHFIIGTGIPSKKGRTRSPKVFYQYHVISERAAGIDKLLSIATPGEVEHTVFAARLEVSKRS